MEVELTCGVCWDLFDQPVLLPCGHSFCRKCINATIFNQYTEFPQFGPNVQEFNCPVCQQMIKLQGERVADELPPNRALESIVTLHIARNPCHLNDIPWNREHNYKEDVCMLHRVGMCQYCQSCDVVVCTDCVRSKHSTHLVVQMKEYAVKIQSEIASGLAEIKRKCSSLEENIAMIEDVINGINENQKQIEKQLGSEIEQLMGVLRSKQDELRQDLQNDFQLLRKPFQSYLSKCQGLNRSVDDLKKRLFEIQQSQNTSSRIKLMQQAKKQLNTLQCYDLATQMSQKMPEVNMPKWLLLRNSIDSNIRSMKWQRSDRIQSNKGDKGGNWNKRICVETQTDLDQNFTSTSLYSANRINKTQPTGNFAKFVASHASGRSSPVNSIENLTDNEEIHSSVGSVEHLNSEQIRLAPVNTMERQHLGLLTDRGAGDQNPQNTEPKVDSPDANDVIVNVFHATNSRPPFVDNVSRHSYSEQVCVSDNSRTTHKENHRPIQLNIPVSSHSQH